LKLRLLVALAQISLGTFVAWGCALVLTVVLLTTAWEFTGSRAFGTAAIMTGFTTLGVGAVAQGQTSAYINRWHKFWAQFEMRVEEEPRSSTTLTTFGVALFVAPQLLLVGALAYG
jgi:hypothetical protein